MADTLYYEILREGLPGELRIKNFVHGVSWTAAVLSDGSVGVAMHTTGRRCRGCSTLWSAAR